MPRPLQEKALSPRCKTCGRDTARLGKLPRVGLRPLVHVYKCGACNQIVSIEPDQQDEAESALARKQIPAAANQTALNRSPTPRA